MAPPQTKRKLQGRKKTQMRLIEDEKARTVTFYKRQVGLFKKATELSILCGAHIAIIIFSRSGRAYTFGHPTVESAVGSFLNREPIPNPHVPVAFLANLKGMYDEKAKELMAMKGKTKKLEAALVNSGGITEESLNEMDVNQLHDLKQKLEKFRDDMKLGSAGPSQSRAVPNEINLVDIEGDGHGGSLIPADWLKI